MKILTTSATGQSIKIIPRTFASVNNIIVRDEVTNKSFTYSSVQTSFTSNNYLTFLVTGTGMVDSDSNTILKENRFYNLTVNSSSEIIYKDKFFVTNQNLTNGNYDINSGEYTISNNISSDNEYITV
jgi:hypothetical protein|tara:strand:+ start:668 stop:1048 length:381 start_codon:yes stop_codon:yes gene_type:complete